MKFEYTQRHSGDKGSFDLILVHNEGHVLGNPVKRTTIATFYNNDEITYRALEIILDKIKENVINIDLHGL